MNQQSHTISTGIFISVFHLKILSWIPSVNFPRHVRGESCKLLDAAQRLDKQAKCIFTFGPKSLARQLSGGVFPLGLAHGDLSA